MDEKKVDAIGEENPIEEDTLEAITETNTTDEPTDAQAEDGDHSSEGQHFVKQEKTDEYHWYVIHVYSGYENKVMANVLDRKSVV